MRYRTRKPPVRLRLLVLAARATLHPGLPASLADDDSSTVDSSGAEAIGLREEVVVTVGRIDQELRDVAGSISVLTREDVRRSASRTVDDFLRQIPGFGLFRRSSSVVAHPTIQGVSLRGISPSGASRILVLVDGVPANDPFGGWVHWSRIPLQSVEQVEVLRGGSSNVWGNHALGGVINVRTRDIPEREFAVVADAGNREELGLQLFAGRRRERLGWSLQGNLFNTNGHHVIREDQRGPIDVAAFSEHRLLKGRLELHASERMTVTFQANYAEEDRGNGTPLTNNSTDGGQISVSADLATTSDGGWHFELFVDDQTFGSTFSAQSEDRAEERPALDQFAVDSSGIGGSLTWTRRVADRHRLIAGADARRIGGQTNEDFLWDGQAFVRRRRAGGDQQISGVFLQDLVELSDALQITLGVRFDSWDNTNGFRREVDLTDGSVLRSDTFADRSDSAMSPKLAARYRATDRVALRGSLYRSFRAPTINELYRPFRVRNDITEANPDLDPETLNGAEVGLDWSDSHALWRFTAFWNRVDGPIANVTLAEAPSSGVIAPCGFVPAGGSCRQRQNLGETRILGFEAEVRTRLADFWNVSASYLYSEGEITDSPNQPELEGKRIAQVPGHQLTFGVAYDPPQRLGTRLQARYVGEQFEDDLNQRELASFVVVDLSFWRDLTAGLAAFAGVENLFGEVYEVGRSATDLVTIGAPRRMHAGVRWSVGRRGRGQHPTGQGKANAITWSPVGRRDLPCPPAAVTTNCLPSAM